jgi:hypothetical protein
MPYFLGAVVVMWKFQWHVCGFLFTSLLAKLLLGVFYHQIKFNHFHLPLFFLYILKKKNLKWEILADSTDELHNIASNAAY